MEAALAKRQEHAGHKTAEARTTTDHDEIRQWAEACGGKPGAVKSTHRGGDAGTLRLIFPGAPNANEDSLEEISWEEFFEKALADNGGPALHPVLLRPQGRRVTKKAGPS